MASGLTPKQEYDLFSHLAFAKLDALGKLAAHFGLAGKPSQSELRDRWESYGAWVPSLLLRIVGEKTPRFSRCASAWLLDYIVPEWRERLGASVVGYAVERDSPEVRAWRNAVFARDGRRCVRCGSGANLHAHHVAHWAKYPEGRVDIGNGLTLCETCHIEEHSSSRRNSRSSGKAARD